MEYLSQERHDQIAAELDNLINVEYPRIRDELSEARAQGDLSENFEYHTARRALLHRKALLLLVTHAVVLHCLQGVEVHADCLAREESGLGQHRVKLLSHCLRCPRPSIPCHIGRSRSCPLAQSS